METYDVPEIRELADWVRQNVLNEPNSCHNKTLSKPLKTPDNINATSSRENTSGQKMLSQKEEEIHLMEFIIGIDGLN